LASGREASGSARAGCGTGWPKAAAKITGHLDVLLAFYGCPPAEHRIDLRTANPIESAFARRASPARPSTHPASSRWSGPAR
jgi:hypothetical protein